MRISTSTIYDMGVARITELQTRLAKTQQQLATGRRILTPADDPVAAARVLDVNQELAINTQLSRNRATAVSLLNRVEGTLSSVSDIIENVKELIVRAGNPTLSDHERGFLAVELQGAFDDLLAFANTKDASGDYLFSGYKVTAQSFTATTAGADYNGDRGQRMIQVGPSREIAVSETGETVFRGGGQDLFNTISDLIAVLKSPASSPAQVSALNAGLATANGEINKALDNVLTVRASIGSRLKELDALDSAGRVLDEHYQQTLGGLQDVDYAEAISRLSQDKLTLEASQRSFVSVASLSLFNYLS